MSNPNVARHALTQSCGLSLNGRGGSFRTTDTRRSDRVPLSCEVEFKRHGHSRYRVDLFDISPQGCCLSPPIRVDIGDTISLRIPDLEAIHGKVAWVQGWKAGVQFDQPFHAAVFDQLISRLGGPSATS